MAGMSFACFGEPVMDVYSLETLFFLFVCIAECLIPGDWSEPHSSFGVF